MAKPRKIKGEQVLVNTINREELARKIYEKNPTKKGRPICINIEENALVIELKESSNLDMELYNRLGGTNVPISYIAKEMNFRPERVRAMIKSGCINIGTYSYNPNGRDSFYCAASRVYSVLGIIYEPALAQSIHN